MCCSNLLPTTMNPTNKPITTISTMTAFVTFTFSVWVLLFAISLSAATSFVNFLIGCDAFWNALFSQWLGKNRSNRSSKVSNKPIADEPAQNPVSNASNSGSKRSAPWKMENQPGKKATVTVHPTSTSLNIRNVYVVFRTFRYNDELMGFAVWNTFVWKETIDHLYGYPVNAYLRIADILLPTHQPPFIEQQEGTTYTNSNNHDEVGKHSLAHLLLFSNAERAHFNLRQQLQGFHFITKRGMDQVPPEKWLNGQDGNYGALTEDELSEELNTARQQCDDFLSNACAASQNPTTPGTFLNSNARYTMIRQRRNIPDGCMDIFDRLLSTARGNVSRHIPEQVVAPIESQTGEI